MNQSALLSKALAVVVLLLASAAFADSPLDKVRHISARVWGGVDFSINELTLPDGNNERGFIQATQCVNWDLSKGTLTKRDGYALKINANANVRGLFGYINRDGEKRQDAHDPAR